MPNYRYSTPEYMRRGNNTARLATCQNEKTCAAASYAATCAPVSSCGNTACGVSSTFSDMPIAMAYVPWQDWCSIYEVEKGLHCGTIFKELYKPFLGMGGCS